MERFYLPAGTRLGVSVPVRADGFAEVAAEPAVRELPPDQLERALAQLAWTLRQVGEVQRFQVTVDGTPVELPGGSGSRSRTWTSSPRRSRQPRPTSSGCGGGAVVQVVGDR